MLGGGGGENKLLTKWGSYPGSNLVVIRGVVALVGGCYIFKWKLGLVARHNLLKIERKYRGGGCMKTLKTLKICVCVFVCVCVYECAENMRGI